MNDDDDTSNNEDQTFDTQPDSSPTVEPPLNPPASPYGTPYSPPVAPPVPPHSIPSIPNPSVPPQQPNQGYIPPAPPQPPQGYSSAPMPGSYYSNGQGIQVGGPKSDPFAITSLSTGITGIVLSCACMLLGFILGTIAIIFGILSINRVNKSGNQLTGKGLAIAGISTGCVGVGIASIFMIIYGISFFNSWNY